MIGYSWKSIKNNKRASILIFFSLAAIFIAAPMTISALFDIQTNVEDNIQQYARGSYDLLIRPEGAQTEIEKSIGKVEENYLNYGDGGISIEEWKEIKNLDSVEIAAPVASLGYFTGEDKTLSLAYPSSSSYIEFAFSTYDGVNEYALLDEGGFFYMLEQDEYEEGFDFYGENRSSTKVAGMKPEFVVPTTYHLTVGVDQEEEEKLSRVNLSALQNPIPPDLQMGFGDLGAKDIPIIYLSDSQIPLKGKARLTDISWNSGKTLSLKKHFNLKEEDPLFFGEDRYWEEMPEILSDIERRSTETYEVSLSDFMNPFYYEPLSYNYDGTFSEEFNYAFGVTESSRFYFTKPIDYNLLDDGNMKVHQIGVETGIPTYREIEEHGASTVDYYASGEEEDIPFLLYPVGSFTTESYQDSIASSPLGIYQQAPSVTVDGVTLHETITPGSFVSSPAHGIMSLEDAAYIKGENPIDAIRLKVSGISAYNEDAVEKINEVIVALTTIGDYDITVVAGASPSVVTLDVEGIGLVEQSWTSLGAAATISEGWNTTNQLIAGLFVVISFLYILNHSLFRKYTKTGEQTLLLDLGWSTRHIQQFHLLENVLLILFAALTSGIVLAAFYSFEIVSLLTLPIFGTIFVLTLGVTWINIVVMKRKPFNALKGIKFKELWLRNLSFYKKLISISFIQLICAALLVNFVLGALYITSQNTGQTNLGMHINDMILFLVGVVLLATIYLVITTMIESISSFLLIRKEEILTLRDIGWRMREIRRMYVGEFLAWIIPSIGLGMIFNLLLFVLLFTVSIEIIAIASAVTMVLVFIGFIVAIAVVRKTVITLA
ncbi:hypothetical protein [Alkalicoccobacillus porphyridii]|uniref:ABC transporter permease n=1 Tax=Alkalicoccobacillus porphyridii TaxID=2597270 RepID=A0A554A3G5_9BACI|nr:hypothetical protein [Alkalicoccobacillus porphyridii]TSB48231.1 hypothetical protein FN960_01375 [Alkalicoccobacillus porphyridii]